MRLVFDTNVLNLCCHPRTQEGYGQRLAKRFISDPDFEVIIPAIVAYELRRGYILKSSYGSDPAVQATFRESIRRLDYLIRMVGLSPLTREILDHAAKLWADCRGRGLPNTNEDRIDIDVIVAAEAVQMNAEVLTQNAKDFTKHGLKIATL